MITTNASTFVPITREELEDWLDTLPLAGRWVLRPGSVGVYLLPVGENVAVKLSSSIGSRDGVLDKGKASMQLSLVSLLTGQTLNKKAQGQAYFTRTLQWKKNWKEGIQRMQEAYKKAQGFYDALALIEDRNQYKDDLLERIEKIYDWQNHPALADFHRRVQAGGILTTAQAEVIVRAEKNQPSKREINQELLQNLRQLWLAAKQAHDQWTMDFAYSVGTRVKSGGALSEKQMAAIEKAFDKYRIS